MLHRDSPCCLQWQIISSVRDFTFAILRPYTPCRTKWLRSDRYEKLIFENGSLVVVLGQHLPCTPLTSVTRGRHYYLLHTIDSNQSVYFSTVTWKCHWSKTQHDRNITWTEWTTWWALQSVGKSMMINQAKWDETGESKLLHRPSTPRNYCPFRDQQVQDMMQKLLLILPWFLVLPKWIE